MGRIDLIINSDYTLPLLLDDMNISLDKFEKVYTVFESQAGYMGFNKSISLSLIRKISLAFDELKNNGEIDRTINEYMRRIKAGESIE